MNGLKRSFDLFWAILGMVFLVPLFGLIALAIKLDDGGPVFFGQERVGRGSRHFRMWKFRTMVTDAEQRGRLLTVGRDPRITRLGAWLRRLKFDELPQVWNVIRGEMSLVGPRPEVPRYVALYRPEQRAVLDLMPGITDPASIHYVDESAQLAVAQDPERTYIETIMPDKIKINLNYARQATVWTDFQVILRTFLRIVH